MSRPKQQPNCLPEPVTQIATQPRDSREDKFLDLLFVAKSVREAAIMAGYSEDYCQSTVYQKFKSPAFQSKLIQRYKDNCYTDLPLIQMISRAGLKRIHEDLVSGNGDLAAKLKHIPRQILEITRLLQPEGTQGPTLVNIENLQMLVNGKFNGKPDPTGGDSE